MERLQKRMVAILMNLHLNCLKDVLHKCCIIIGTTCTFWIFIFTFFIVEDYFGQNNLEQLEHHKPWLWACECEWWACERQQVSPNEYFQEYFVDVNKIFFDTWVGIFCDRRIFCHMAMDEQYFWMKQWMINKMDDLFFFKWMPNLWKIMDEPLSHSYRVE